MQPNFGQFESHVFPTSPGEADAYWDPDTCHCGRGTDLYLLAYICNLHACSSKGLHATCPEAMIAFSSIQTSLLQMVVHTVANVGCKDATILESFLSAVRGLNRLVLLVASGPIL